jgi:hypothetical protein
MGSPRPQFYTRWRRSDPSKYQGEEGNHALRWSFLPLPGPSPSFRARGVARFAVTRGQPLDPAEGRGPSDSLIF